MVLVAQSRKEKQHMSWLSKYPENHPVIYDPADGSIHWSLTICSGLGLLNLSKTGYKLQDLLFYLARKPILWKGVIKHSNAVTSLTKRKNYRNKSSWLKDHYHYSAGTLRIDKKLYANFVRLYFIAGEKQDLIYRRIQENIGLVTLWKREWK